MKAYGEWMYSSKIFDLSYFTPEDEIPRYTLGSRLDGAHSQSGRYEEERNTPTFPPSNKYENERRCLF
jgi:hypothetical protein